MFTDSGTQTEWKYPRTACTQYYPREFSQSEQDDLFKSKDISEFVTNVVPRYLYFFIRAKFKFVNQIQIKKKKKKELYKYKKSQRLEISVLGNEK